MFVVHGFCRLADWRFFVPLFRLYCVVVPGFAGLRAGVFVAHGAVPHVRPPHGRQGARVPGRHVLSPGPRKASQQPVALVQNATVRGKRGGGNYERILASDLRDHHCIALLPTSAFGQNPYRAVLSRSLR